MIEGTDWIIYLHLICPYPIKIQNTTTIHIPALQYTFAFQRRVLSYRRFAPIKSALLDTVNIYHIFFFTLLNLNHLMCVRILCDSQYFGNDLNVCPSILNCYLFSIYFVSMLDALPQFRSLERLGNSLTQIDNIQEIARLEWHVI